MKCRYVKEIYKNKENGYCVYIYQTEDEDVPPAARNQFNHTNKIQFTATGNSLPQNTSVDVELSGKWKKDKHGLQLCVDGYEEILPRTLDGIKGYLSSGMIKGIGPKTAERIADRFGEKTFEILDKQPEKLLQVKGITEKRLKTILNSCQENHAMRDLTAYLTPYGISIHKIQKIYGEYGRGALNIVMNSPFSLCRISGFGFLAVDQIARANKCRPNDLMRMEACIQYCMDQIMQMGHLYQDMERFTVMVYKALNEGFRKEVVSQLEINTCIYRMTQEKLLVIEQRAVYTALNYHYEKAAAEIIARMLLEKDSGDVYPDLPIAEAQKELGLNLSAKQVDAVKMVFTNKLSIITGGPGTGKTTVEKVLMYVYKKNGGNREMLMAPTGRASRRMAESTGIASACTMHSGLSLTCDDTDYEPILETLDADFIILDEQSMVDMRLACIFFQQVTRQTRIVLIGDVNQLPSVKPGNVFRELVQCGVVPVTELNMVYRQKNNSRIAANAHLMQENIASLEYGEDFMFLQAASDREASDVIRELYLESVKRVGVENVQILSPYRKSGAASVNVLNELLREEINPGKPGKAEMKANGKLYREGDKIIQNKNRGEISNGDIGFIRSIFLNEDGTETAELDFGNGRRVEYDTQEMEFIEHSYAITVHKSQGGEYPVVIIPWIPDFYRMLKRNILYTGITRAQSQVFIVGNKKSITEAIHSPQADNRNTRLGERVAKLYYSLQSQKDEEPYEQISLNL